jgi:hypothetical protein
MIILIINQFSDILLYSNNEYFTFEEFFPKILSLLKIRDFTLVRIAIYMFFSLCVHAAENNKLTENNIEFIKNNLNSLYPFLKVTPLSSSRNITASPFVIRGIFMGLNCLCKNKDIKLQLQLNGCTNMLNKVLRFYLPYVFSTTETVCRRFYCSKEKLFNKICETDEFNPTYSQCMFTASSKDFAFGVKTLFIEGVKLLHNLMIGDELDYANFNLVFDIVREYVNFYEEIPLKIDTSSSKLLEIEILNYVCRRISLCCLQATMKKIQSGGKSEIETRLTTTENLSLLCRFFVILNPQEVTPSLLEEDITNSEFILCGIALSILCMFGCKAINISNAESVFSIYL